MTETNGTGVFGSDGSRLRRVVPPAFPRSKKFFKNRSKLVRKRLRHRARIFLAFYLRRRAKRPFVLLATRRSGTNLFLSYLNSVSSVSFAGEVLHPEMYYGLRERFITKGAVLRHIRHTLNALPTEVCGIKLLYMRLKFHHVSLEDVLRVSPETRFFVLYRRSLAEQFLSLKIAQTTNQWMWSDRFRLPEKIRLDPDEMLAHYHLKRSWYREIFQNPSVAGRVLVLAYEDIVAGPQRVFDERVFPFLGIAGGPVRTGLVKQNTKRPGEIVENFDAVRHLFEGPIGRQDYDRVPERGPAEVSYASFVPLIE